MAKYEEVVCPECGAEIPEGQIMAHAHSHWAGEPERIKYPEASARFMELFEAAKDRGEV